MRHLSAVLLAFSLSLPALAHEPAPTEGGQAPVMASEPADLARESQLLSNPRQLIFTGRRSGEGYFSADGRRLIFQSEREPGNPFFQMYLLDFASGETTRVSPGSGKTTCGWIRPDGQGVMFSSTHADPETLAHQKAELDFRASGQTRRYSWDFDPFYDIYAAANDGSHPVNLTHTRGYDAEGDYSPDGRQVVFASNRQAYAGKLSAAAEKQLQTDPSWFMDLYIMNSDGSNVRRLTDGPGYDGGPFFSPDGSRIVFRRFNEAGDRAEVWSMKTDGSDQRQLTHLGVMSWAPFYHPSGDYLIFATNKHGFGNFELYLVDTAGSHEPVRVTSTEGFDGLPVFSPDGQQLVWTSNRSSDSSSQLFIAGWNDTEARRLLSLPLPQSTGPDPVTASRPLLPPETRFQTEAEITGADLQKRVSYLASPELAGRLTGSPGEALATDYAAEVFRRLGLTPAGDAGSYIQSFKFTAGVELGAGNKLAEGAHGYTLNKDWVPLTMSASASIDPTDVVFAGYGLRAPATHDFKGYDSYVHLDVRDKWVLALRYWPEQMAQASQQEIKRYSALHYKAMLAREQGARGLIVVSGPNSPDKLELIPFQGQGSSSAGSLPAISVSNAVAGEWFRRSGQDLKTLQTRLDSGEFVQGFALKDLRLAGRIELKKTEGTGHNVLALLQVPGAT
ncbi:MAG: peptidase M28, partial [Candidatus Sericytochromatia bacterium]